MQSPEESKDSLFDDVNDEPVHTQAPAENPTTSALGKAPMEDSAKDNADRPDPRKMPIVEEEKNSAYDEADVDALLAEDEPHDAEIDHGEQPNSQKYRSRRMMTTYSDIAHLTPCMRHVGTSEPVLPLKETKQPASNLVNALPPPGDTETLVQEEQITSAPNPNNTSLPEVPLQPPSDIMTPTKSKKHVTIAADPAVKAGSSESPPSSTSVVSPDISKDHKREDTDQSLTYSSDIPSFDKLSLKLAPSMSNLPTDFANKDINEQVDQAIRKEAPLPELLPSESVELPNLSSGAAKMNPGGVMVDISGEQHVTCCPAGGMMVDISDEPNICLLTFNIGDSRNVHYSFSLRSVNCGRCQA
jgi:hypothetical protein